MKLKKCTAIILMLASLTMMAGCQVSTPSKTGEQSDTSSGKYS